MITSDFVPQKKNFSILLIDDSRTIRSLVELVLTKNHYDITTTDSIVGLAKYVVKVDLVIIDYNMPGINGDEVLRNLKSASKHLTTQPSYFLFTTENDKATAFKQYGFDGVITNKSKMDSFLEQINEIYKANKRKSK